MHADRQACNEKQQPEDREACQLLATTIDDVLQETREVQWDYSNIVKLEADWNA